jgi:hypothetical protein
MKNNYFYWISHILNPIRIESLANICCQFAAHIQIVSYEAKY